MACDALRLHVEEVASAVGGRGDGGFICGGLEAHGALWGDDFAELDGDEGEDGDEGLGEVSRVWVKAEGGCQALELSELLVSLHVRVLTHHLQVRNTATIMFQIRKVRKSDGIPCYLLT